MYNCKKVSVNAGGVKGLVTCHNSGTNVLATVLGLLIEAKLFIFKRELYKLMKNKVNKNIGKFFTFKLLLQNGAGQTVVSTLKIQCSSAINTFSSLTLS